MFSFAKKLDFANAQDFQLVGAERKAQYTPDIWRLEQNEWQLLFVYDTFMERHENHAIIQEHIYQNKPLYSGFTADDHWGLWKKKLGKDSFPIPLINKYRNPNAFLRHNAVGRIKGELVAVRPYMFIDLDKHYKNKYEFNRYRSTIWVPYRKKVLTNLGVMVTPETTQTVRAWMYVGVPSFWDQQLDGGLFFEPVKSFDPPHRDGKWRMGRYFYWSLGEYNHQPTSFTMS